MDKHKSQLPTTRDHQKLSSIKVTQHPGFHNRIGKWEVTTQVIKLVIEHKDEGASTHPQSLFSIFLLSTTKQNLFTSTSLE